MEYYSTDLIDGINQPRGEICFKSSWIFAGYYKNPELTDEVVDNEKWFHTGDIGMILPNGALKIIGRK